MMQSIYAIISGYIVKCAVFMLQSQNYYNWLLKE